MIKKSLSALALLRVSHMVPILAVACLSRSYRLVLHLHHQYRPRHKALRRSPLTAT